MPLPPLADEERLALARSAVMACVTAALLLPLQRLDSASAVAGELLPTPRIGRAFQLQLARPAQVVVHRDPFAMAAAPAMQGAPASGDAAALTLPPNDAVDAASAENADQATVRGVIAGSVPQALLEAGGRTRIVGVGDRIAGVQIVKIDLAGLVLADGRRLSLERSTPR